MRYANRESHELRPVEIVRHYTKHAEGSVLISFGDTRVICNASVTPGVPPFLRDKGMGWVTAEYGMLPRSTNERMMREAAKGKQVGRTQEIQRLIGRSLRAAVDLTKIAEYTITIDCDVLQADGGTRTAAITGGCVALYDALAWLLERNPATQGAFAQWVTSVSVGICQKRVLLDLDYPEDSQAETDMNVVMTADGQFIELQGTAERQTFSENDLTAMLAHAKAGIAALLAYQKQSVGAT